MGLSKRIASFEQSDPLRLVIQTKLAALNKIEAGLDDACSRLEAL